MSGTLKVLLIVAILGALTSGVFAFLIVSKKNDISKERDDAKTLVQQRDSQIKKVQGELTTKNSTLKDTESQLSEATTRVEALQTQAAEAEKKASDLEASYKEANAKVTESEAKIQKINDLLGGKDPADVKAEAAKAQEELTAVRSEQRVLKDQLQSATTDLQRVTEQLRHVNDGQLPPGISGKIETVNRTWNFVVLNIGDKDGVIRNGTLIVYRGNSYIGKVKVVTTEAHTAVADILPEASKGDIQAGDDVLN